MKHAQAKGKTLKFNASTKYGEAFKDGIKARIERFLDAQYYDIKNVLNMKDKGNCFEVKADKLIKFFFNEEDARGFIESFNVKSVLEVLTKDEKVNRYCLELVGASLECKYTLPEGGKLDGECEVTFRSGGDYTVKREGRDDLSYGPKLKAGQFTEEGFSIQAFDGSVVNYKLA